jgi:histidine phosphotransfer protein HptB
MRAEKDTASALKDAIIANSLRKHGPDWTDLKRGGFDPDALWQRVEGDRELLRELTAVFENEFPAILASIETAIRQHDAAGLVTAGHKVKGAVLQFSAEAAAAAARELEQIGQSGTLAGAETALAKLKHETELLVKSLHRMTGEKAQ